MNKEEYIIVDENGKKIFNEVYTEIGANKIWDMYNGIYEDENGERYMYIEKIA
ncbi:MAG: hypothetical protein MJ231_02205 [bacterium]|nr:hypothetical protein [bacterium]